MRLKPSVFRLAFILSGLLVARVMASDRQPFDLIEASCAPYMAPDDPLGLPLKIRTLARSRYSFWRGSRVLFYQWSKTRCADWYADRPAYITTHGDLHLGNIGSYAAAGPLGSMGFGPVDFDDSDELPFQIELLSGLITLELIASENEVDLEPPQRRQLVETLVKSYRRGLVSGRSATDLLADEPVVRNCLARSGIEYRQALDEFTENGRFRSLVRGRNGKIREILRPADVATPDIAAAIAEAIAHSPEGGAAFRYRTVEQIRPAILDVTLRCRLGSSGSQGLKKYLVLLHRPLVKENHDVIIYLKQAIPSAAQRAGVALDPQMPPAQRLADDLKKLTYPAPWFSSWCRIGSESYWVTLKEPWSVELDDKDIRSADDLLAACRIWGTTVGAAHAANEDSRASLNAIDDRLKQQLLNRSEAYQHKLDDTFTRFTADPRVATIVRETDAVLAKLDGN